MPTFAVDFNEFKQLLVLRFSGLISLILLLGVLSCTKKSENTVLSFNSLVAGGVGLGSATAYNVPSNATIVATMTSAVNPATANSNTILLVRAFDTLTVDLTITVNGNTITMVPKTDLGSGINYTLTFTSIYGTDGTIMSFLWRSFTTSGNWGPPGLVAYWNFEGNTYDQQKNYTVTSVTDLNYAKSLRNSLGQCAAFNGTSTMIEVANADQLLNTTDFSLSFWVKANSQYQIDSLGNPKRQMVLGLGDYKGFEFEIASDYSSCKFLASYAVSNGTTVTEELSFAGDGKTQNNGGLPGWIYCENLTTSGGVAGQMKDKWALVAITYKSSTRIGTLYINGVIMKQQDFNQWPAGDPARNITGMKYGGSAPQQENILAMGFFHSAGSEAYSGTSWGNYYSPYADHFKGWLDELRIFHSALSSIEVWQMFLISKPY
jgi:Bacterial Ig-like domain/Concanavalin A-like lectin/glucanases superfamily